MTLAVIEPSPGEWDTFVQHHSQGHLLQLSPWGCLKSAFDWSVQRIAVVSNQASTSNGGHSHTLLAGAQMLFRTRYAVSVAYVPRGPLLSDDRAVDDLLLATLARAARHRRAVFLRLEPDLLENDSQADAWHTRLLLKGFRPVDPIQPRSTIHLDLAQPLECIFASFSKGHRADIRRAERQGVVARAGDARDIETFYAILEATGKRAAFGIHTNEYYRLVHELFQERCRLFLAEQDGQAIAGHMVFADSHTGLYFYSGATEAGLKSGANHLLQWHAIQWARQQNCRCYDLWGIPDALGRMATTPDERERAALETEAQQDPLIGVYRFKKGFGGHITRYLPAYDQVYLPPLYALWRRKVQ